MLNLLQIVFNIIQYLIKDKYVVCRKATFFSRSRNSSWVKGETSNNYINVYNVYVDCDKDSLIYLGIPNGPSCHTGKLFHI